MYWVRTMLLDPTDEKPKRPVMVARIPQTTAGTVTVAVRSTTDKNGQEHPPQPRHGLNRTGWFSKLTVVQCELWTPDHAEPCDLLVDEETFCYVCLDFDL